MRKIISFIIMSLLVVTAAFAYNPWHNPTPKTKGQLDKEIRRTLSIVHRHIADFTGDGKTNCMDYTMLFYYAWNLLATNRNFEECDIVINRHGSLNHAFICIYYYDKKMNKNKLYIEPQTKDGLSYHMRDAWGSRYNQEYNEVATQWYVDSFGLPKVSLHRYFYE